MGWWAETWKKLTGGGADTAEPEPDAGAELSDRALGKLWAQWLKQGAIQHGYAWQPDLMQAPLYEQIKALPREQGVRLALVAARELKGVTWQRDKGFKHRTAVQSGFTVLLKRGYPFTDAQLAEVIAAAASCGWYPELSNMSNPVRAVERRAKEGPIEGGLRDAAQALLDKLSTVQTAEARKVAARLQVAIDPSEGSAAPDAGGVPLPAIEPGEAWSDAALADHTARAPALQAAFADLFAHCTRATSSKPSKRWQKTAAGLIEAVGRAQLEAAVLSWFPLVDKPRTQHRERRWAGEPEPDLLIVDGHMDVLRGLCWLVAGSEDDAVVRALGQLVISTTRKVPGLGPRAVRVSNAAIWALGQTPGPAALGQLAMLQVRLKHKPSQRSVAKALQVAAEREGLPPDEISELAVPSYGLTQVGRREQVLGSHTAILEIGPTSRVSLGWRREDGRPLKSVPAAVKRDHSAALAELRATRKDLERMLSAQKQRLDRLLLRRRPWPLDAWRERYLDHPVVGALARRLIWLVGEEASIWHDGALRDLDGRPVQPGETDEVRLWHPIGRDPDEVLAWRRWLWEHDVTQPFKQAWREIYILTPAEESTGIYSNRFASHILRQHAAMTLATARGWDTALMLMVDQDVPVPHVVLADWGLRAEFWVDGAGDQYGEDTNETGVYLYVSTDQVRFYPADSAIEGHSLYGRPDPRGGEPLPLSEVDPLVFSEVMRDVDLLVGVCSVGTDPAWQDGGRRPEWDQYWQGFAFGGLSETARTRRTVLEQLLPRLAIAGQARVEDRWVVVEGRRGRYRIHIGSGNIQILPSRRYLCIVPSRGTAGQGKVMLPFEGDRILSVVLSKAMLLARDDQITDPTILAQLPG